MGLALPSDRMSLDTDDVKKKDFTMAYACERQGSFTQDAKIGTRTRNIKGVQSRRRKPRYQCLMAHSDSLLLNHVFHHNFKGLHRSWAAFGSLTILV